MGASVICGVAELSVGGVAITKPSLIVVTSLEDAPVGVGSVVRDKVSLMLESVVDEEVSSSCP